MRKRGEGRVTISARCRCHGHLVPSCLCCNHTARSNSTPLLAPSVHFLSVLTFIPRTTAPSFVSAAPQSATLVIVSPDAGSVTCAEQRAEGMAYPRHSSRGRTKGSVRFNRRRGRFRKT
jgi:hypothetical protein